MQPDALRFSGNGTALRNQTLQDSAIPDIDQLLLASLHNTTYSEGEGSASSSFDQIKNGFLTGP
jgi:hypothetical protein